MPAHTLHRLPDSLALREGAMVEPIAVACHDVRMSDLKAGEFACVIGGGPIGILVALVAQARGARVVMAEVNPFRLQLARDLGIDAVNPLETDLAAVGQRARPAARARTWSSKFPDRRPAPRR